jgi:hypothetical protein
MATVCRIQLMMFFPTELAGIAGTDFHGRSLVMVLPGIIDDI